VLGCRVLARRHHLENSHEGCGVQTLRRPQPITCGARPCSAAASPWPAHPTFASCSCHVPEQSSPPCLLVYPPSKVGQADCREMLEHHNHSVYSEHDWQDDMLLSISGRWPASSTTPESAGCSANNCHSPHAGGASAVSFSQSSRRCYRIRTSPPRADNTLAAVDSTAL
jgi:hypothetical protein